MTVLSCVDEFQLVTVINEPRGATQRWDRYAACADLPLAAEHYFPDDGELPTAEALACCITCPVAMQCLATAMIHEAADGLRFGWWGGCGPAERGRLAERIGLATSEVEIEDRRPADLARILRAHERTIPSIAAELGCTERTVYRYLASTAA